MNSIYTILTRPNINNTNPPVLCLIGDGGCGKTSLKDRLTKSKTEFKFNHEYVASEGVTFIKINFMTNYGIISLCLEDTPGQLKFDSIRSGIIKGADIVIAMYDITVPKTKENINGWLKYLDNCHKKPIIMVMGNKLDEDPLASMHKTVHMRQVQLETKFNGQIDHCQVSIKERTNLKTAFETILRNYYKLSDLKIEPSECSFRI